MSIKAVSRPETIASAKTTTETRWKLETPEYLLLLVIWVILWTFGFIELLNRTSTNPTIFGLYSTAYFAVLAAYTSGFLVWAALLARPSHSGWLTQSVSFIQNRIWLALGMIAIFGVLIWNLVTVESFTDHPFARLGSLPFLRFTLVGLLVLLCGVIIFGGWGKNGPVAVWRKGVALILAVVLGIEILIQIAALGGWLPGAQRIDNVFVPYGRVYQNAEGLGNGRVNNFGWYYPDFRLTEGSKRVLLVGDTYIQALQIDREEHLGVTLESLLAADQTEPNLEVLALGMPGFGPGLYLSDTRLADTVLQFQPDEIVLFFHLGNDFQYATVPTPDDVVYEVTAEGGVIIHSAGTDYLHHLKHFILTGYSRLIDPLATLRGNYLTPRVLVNLGSAPEATANPLDIPGYRGYVIDKIETKSAFALITQVGLAKVPGASNFMFKKTANSQAEEALAVARGLLQTSHAYLASEGVTLRIVTIPVFPAAFYTKYQGRDWTPEIGPYDLFGPERALHDFARERNIPFLPLGQYMQEGGLTIQQVKALYYADGLGHFTPQGHDFVAQAIYRCFFATDLSGRSASSGLPEACGGQ